MGIPPGRAKSAFTFHLYLALTGVCQSIMDTLGDAMVFSFAMMMTIDWVFKKLTFGTVKHPFRGWMLFLSPTYSVEFSSCLLPTGTLVDSDLDDEEN